MLCPVCKIDMFVLEFEQVEIDFCLECRGVWLDSGELELVGEKAGILQEDLLTALETAPPDAEQRGAKRKCPVCRARLEKVTAALAPPLELDRCPRGHGLWFDQGELSAVVRAAEADENNVLAQFFADLESGGDEGATDSATV